MNSKQLKLIETELEKRGYRKWTTCLTSTESWAWFKTFAKNRNKNGDVVDGYQVAFRVWDWRIYKDRNAPNFGFDFWTSALCCNGRMDFTSNWEPFCNIDTFERMAAEFNQMVRKFVKPENNN